MADEDQEQKVNQRNKLINNFKIAKTTAEKNKIREAIRKLNDGKPYVVDSTSNKSGNLSTSSSQK